jgi:hypothetical protein
VRLALSLACSLVACGASDPPGADGTGSEGASSGASSTSSAGTVTPTTTVDPSGPSTGTTAPSTADESGSSSTAADTGGPFVLDVHTALVDGRLALLCNLPPHIDDCAAIAGAPCDDLDADGLADAWEDAALDRLHPLRRLDEAESLIDDATTVLGDVGRVFAVDDHFRVFVMLGYHLDYGSCGVSGHNGDSERVALDLAAYPDGGAGGVIVAGAYTAAHENTATDHGHVFLGAELDELAFDLDARTEEPRWVVFPSADKHGSYGSIARCEGVSVVPCLDEDCGPDGVDDPSAYDRLPEVVNAGEEAMPRVTALDELGFVGDDAWAMQDFCGGLERTTCSAPVRDKLLVDPF